VSRAELERKYFIRYNHLYFCNGKWSETMAFSTTFRDIWQGSRKAS
jgi:hypothetical protein